MASESEEYEYAYSSDDDDNVPGDGEDEEVSMDWSTAGAADNPNAAPTMLFRGGAGKSRRWIVLAAACVRVGWNDCAVLHAKMLPVASNATVEFAPYFSV